MDLFLEALTDALIDTAKMIPLLFVIYMVIEVVEVRFGNKMGRAVARAGKAGPLIGAACGIVPQCGFSVVGTALYTQKLATIGTLFAVYLATSDEAIPIILSQPEAAVALIPLIGIKLIVAVVAGYALDFVFRRRNAQVLQHVQNYAAEADEPDHDHEAAYDEKGCCGHEPTADRTRKLTARTVLVHPLIHTAKIFAFIFVISLAINLLFVFVGEEAIGQALAEAPLLQPIVAALVGLIPNCAASVAITEFYLSGAITFGAAVAGLCASGGLGILVLIKEDVRADAVKIIAGLWAISVLAGCIIEALGIMA